jgi:hypothetical protein
MLTSENSSNKCIVLVLSGPSWSCWYGSLFVLYLDAMPALQNWLGLPFFEGRYFVIRAHAFDTIQHQSLSLISSNPDHSVISAIIIYILLFFISLGPEWSIKKWLLTIYQITQTKIFIHRIYVQESCSLNYKSVFLLLSLGLYLCWVTNIFWVYQPQFLIIAIIIKTKVLLPKSWVTVAYFGHPKVLLPKSWVTVAYFGYLVQIRFSSLSHGSP